MKSLGHLVVGFFDLVFTKCLDRVIDKTFSKYDAFLLTTALKHNRIEAVKLSEDQTNSYVRIIHFSINETGYSLVLEPRGNTWEPVRLQHTHRAELCVFCKDGVDGIPCMDMSSSNRGLKMLYENIKTNPQFRLKALLFFNKYLRRNLPFKSVTAARLWQLNMVRPMYLKNGTEKKGINRRKLCYEVKKQNFIRGFYETIKPYECQI